MSVITDDTKTVPTRPVNNTLGNSISLDLEVMRRDTFINIGFSRTVRCPFLSENGRTSSGQIDRKRPVRSGWSPAKYRTLRAKRNSPRRGNTERNYRVI